MPNPGRRRATLTEREVALIRSRHGAERQPNKGRLSGVRETAKLVAADPQTVRDVVRWRTHRRVGNQEIFTDRVALEALAAMGVER